ARAAANALGVTLVPVDIRAANEFNAGFQTFVRERVKSVVMLGDALIMTEGRQIAEATQVEMPVRDPKTPSSNADMVTSTGVSTSCCWALRSMECRALPVVLGGEHAVNIPCVRAFGEHGPIHIVQIRAARRTSATACARGRPIRCGARPSN